MNAAGNHPESAGISPERLGFKRDLHLSSSIVHLPPALDLVPKLLGCLNDQEKSGDLLAELIRLDPGLTVAVLRVANSAAYAGEYRMETLGAAVLRLGLREVYRIVLQVIASPVFLSTSEAAGLNLWQHSFCAGVATQILSQRLGEDPELAFTAGLLHDVGKLVFHQFLGEQYVSLVREAQASDEALYRREAARFGVEHASVGARLLKSWNFPDPIVHSVQFHHDPSQCPKPDIRIVSLVFSANLLAHKIFEAKPLPNDLLMTAKRGIRNLGVSTLDDLLAYETEVKEAFQHENARMPSARAPV